VVVMTYYSSLNETSRHAKTCVSVTTILEKSSNTYVVRKKKNQSKRRPDVVFHNGFRTIWFFIGFLSNRLRKVILDFYPTRYDNEVVFTKRRSALCPSADRCGKRCIDDERWTHGLLTSVRSTTQKQVHYITVSQ